MDLQMGAAFSCQGTLPNQTHHYATGKEFYGEKSHLLPWKLSAISQLLCIFLSNFFVFQYLTNLLCSQYTELWLLLTFGSMAVTLRMSTGNLLSAGHYEKNEVCRHRNVCGPMFCSCLAVRKLLDLAKIQFSFI